MYDKASLKNQNKDLTPYTDEQLDYLAYVLNNMPFPWQPFKTSQIELAQVPGAWRDDFVLHFGDLCYMTTSGQDLCDHAKILQEAKGDVLLTGLGLGVGILLADLNPNITRVTVVEINEHVINLIGSQVAAACTRIKPRFIHADADIYAFGTKEHYDFAFVDHSYQLADDSRFKARATTVVNWYWERKALEATWR
jgi:hypothetical protein